MRFIVSTKHYAGLGFALRLKDEGHDVVLATSGNADRRLEEQYELVGDGLVDKQPLATMVRDRAQWKDAIWVWDENHAVEENETLRAEGFRVFGGGRYPDQMEHDRDACLKLVGQYGLQPPPSFPFASADEGLRFASEHPDTAYVFKPDEGETYETWIPQAENAEEANLELQQHLRSTGQTGPFVLQERKDGIETNVEVWFVKGEPVFAFMNFECKRKLTGDLGDFTGCALDFAFVILVGSRAVQESVGRLFPVYREMQYTGRRRQLHRRARRVVVLRKVRALWLQRAPQSLLEPQPRHARRRISRVRRW
jgi:hypothetical protein